MQLSKTVGYFFYLECSFAPLQGFEHLWKKSSFPLVLQAITYYEMFRISSQYKP